MRRRHLSALTWRVVPIVEMAWSSVEPALLSLRLSRLRSRLGIRWLGRLGIRWTGRLINFLDRLVGLESFFASGLELSGVLSTHRVGKLLGEGQDLLEQGQDSESSASASNDGDGDAGSDQVANDLLLEVLAIVRSGAHEGEGFADDHSLVRGALIHADEVEELRSALSARRHGGDGPAGPVACILVAMGHSVAEVLHLAEALDNIVQNGNGGSDGGYVVHGDFTGVFFENHSDVATVLNGQDNGAHATTGNNICGRCDGDTDVHHCLSSARECLFNSVHSALHI